MTKQDEVKVGDLAPEFTLTSSTGEAVSLRDYRGLSEVVLFFYPKANTPFCTAEACSFRANDDTFRQAGAEVIGISSDSLDSLKRFASLFHLPFKLLSDPKGDVQRKYRVAKTFGIFPGRATFLIDRAGYIRHVFSSQFLPTRHAPEMLEVLKRLREQPSQNPQEGP